MRGLRFEPAIARGGAVATVGLAALFLPFLATTGSEPFLRPAVGVVALATALVAAAAVLLPVDALWVAAIPAATMALPAVVFAVLSDHGSGVAVHALLAPLVFSTVVLTLRAALLPLAIYAPVVVAICATAPAALREEVIVSAVAQTLLGAGIGIAAARFERRNTADRVRIALASASTAAELSQVLSRHVLGGDIVAAAIAVPDAPRPTLAEMAAEAGVGATTRRYAFRVADDESVARAARSLDSAVEVAPAAGSGHRDARFLASRGYAAGAVIPLRAERELVACLLLASSRSGAFDARRLRQLARRHEPLADGVRAYLLRRDRDDRSVLAQAAHAASRELAAAPTVTALWEVVHGAVCTLLHADRVWVSLRDAEGVIAAVAWSDPGLAALRIDTTREVSLAQRAIVGGEPLWVANVPVEPDVNPRLISTYPIEGLLVVPFVGAGGASGAVGVQFDRPRMLTQDEIDTASALVAEAAIAWGRLEAEERLRREATRDALTGLLNRAAFHGALEHALEAANGEARPLSLVLCDLDHLKHLNDFYGHAVGDGALRAVADVLRNCARGDDILGRLGGDEFGWVLPDSTPDDALAAAERVVRAVAAVLLEPAGAISVSAGVASAFGGAGVQALFERADARLYEAKAHGRGVAIAQGPRPRRRATDARMVRARRGDGEPDLAARTAREWVEAFRASAAAITVFRDGAQVTIAQYDEIAGLEPPDPEVYPIDDFPLMAEAIRARATYQISIDDDQHPEETSLLRAWGYSALLFVPVCTDDDVIGAVELYDARRRIYTADEQRLALVLARHLGAALAAPRSA
jgi:diguanylate cyclase (GGDEF)-like protein